MYAEYLAHTLPAGEEALKGDEAAKLRGFLDAAGRADEAAAEGHLDLGQQTGRLRMGQGDLSGAVSELRAFQKLEYVFETVVGTRKSAFLTPWRRACDLRPLRVRPG